MPSIADLQRLLDKSPNDPDLLYGLAMEHAKAARTDEACAHFDRCLAADPTYCYAYYHKARALEAAHRITEALATLRAGLTAAKAARDNHALSELTAYLDDLDA